MGPGLDVRLLVALGTTGVLVAFVIVVPILAARGLRTWDRSDFGETKGLQGIIKDKKRAWIPGFGSIPVQGQLFSKPNMIIRIHCEGDKIGRFLPFMGREAIFNALRIGQEVNVVIGKHPRTGEPCAIEITPTSESSPDGG